MVKWQCAASLVFISFCADGEVLIQAIWCDRTSLGNAWLKLRRGIPANSARNELFRGSLTIPGGICLNKMRVKNIFVNEEDEKVMEINILPSKYCNFRCVFCPVGQDGVQTEKAFCFEETGDFLVSLAARIDEENPDVLFINSMGESFANDQLAKFIDLARQKNVEVRLWGNGYLLGIPEYARLASLCDEVTGEIHGITEASFQKLQRPMEGYTLEKYWSNMIRFREVYDGRLTIAVAIIKDENDDPESLERIGEFLNELKPDKVLLETFTDGKFVKTFGVDEAKMELARQVLLKSSPGITVEIA